MTANSRKVLVPLATLLVAGAVAIGSGATWTSTTSSSVSVTSGDLLHTNNHDDAVLTVANIKPGDTVTGTVEIENTGSLDAVLSFQESGDTGSTFAAGGLNLVIKQDGVELYNGDFGGYANTVHNLGDLDVGRHHDLHVHRLDAGRRQQREPEQDRRARPTPGSPPRRTPVRPCSRTGSDPTRRVPPGDDGTRHMGNMGGSWPARLGGSRAGHPHHRAPRRAETRKEQTVEITTSAPPAAPPRPDPGQPGLRPGHAPRRRLHRPGRLRLPALRHHRQLHGGLPGPRLGRLRGGRPGRDLRVGDVITYQPPADSGVDHLVTHRIVSIEGDVYRTKGDANADVDPWTFQLTSTSQSRVSYSVPYVGYVFLALQDRDAADAPHRRPGGHHRPDQPGPARPGALRRRPEPGDPGSRSRSRRSRSGASDMLRKFLYLVSALLLGAGAFSGVQASGATFTDTSATPLNIFSAPDWTAPDVTHRRPRVRRDRHRDGQRDRVGRRHLDRERRRSSALPTGRAPGPRSAPTTTRRTPAAGTPPARPTASTTCAPWPPTSTTNTRTSTSIMTTVQNAAGVVLDPVVGPVRGTVTLTGRIVNATGSATIAFQASTAGTNSWFDIPGLRRRPPAWSAPARSTPPSITGLLRLASRRRGQRQHLLRHRVERPGRQHRCRPWP